MLWASCCPLTSAAYSADRLRVRIHDLAIRGDQVLPFGLPLGGCQIDQQIARRGRHLAQLQIHGGRRPASERAHVERA